MLQSVAWTSMLAGHLQSESFTEAVAQTFDGRHPCKMCQAIRAAKKSEKTTEFPLSLKKIEFPPLAERLTLFAPSAFKFLSTSDTFAESSALPPPVPPPRVLPV